MSSELYITPKIDVSKNLDRSNAVRGQTALITGGASGIGLGIASELCKLGVNVAIVDLSAVQGEAVAQGLREQGYNCCFLQADVVSYESQLAAFKAAVSWSPSSTLEIVIPCAGIAGSSLVAALSTLGDNQDPPPPAVKTIDVNLYGVYFTTYLAVHYFIKAERESKGQSDAPIRKRPQILFVSSLAGYGDLPLNSSYATAKFGIRGLFRSIRSCSAECGGMRCNLLAPSFIRTPFTEMVIPGILKRNIKVGEVDDAVDGAMRCICDEEVDGRALCIAPSDGSGAGTANFDLCEDFSNHDGGKELFERVSAGVLGEGFADFGRYTKASRETGGWQGYR